MREICVCGLAGDGANVWLQRSVRGPELMTEIGRLQAMITVLWFPSISMTVRASLFAEMPQLHDDCGGPPRVQHVLRDPSIRSHKKILPDRDVHRKARNSFDDSDRQDWAGETRRYGLIARWHTGPVLADYCIRL